MDTWYIALCTGCELKMPFRDQQLRDRWAEAHAQAPVIDGLTAGHHTVERSTETR